MSFYKVLYFFAIASICMMKNTNAANIPYITSHLITTLSVGSVWGSGGETKTLTLAPGIIRTYDPDKTTETIAYSEFFIGVHQNIYTDVQSQFGLAAAITSEAKLPGEIWDDANPLFNNYKYDYKLRHSHAALKGKLLLDKKYIVTPWISGSAGIGFNRTGFDNIPTLDGAVTTPDFKKHTTIAFTYTLGAGLLYKIDQKQQIGIGYEFANWGKSQLKPSAGQTTSQKLSLSRFYTHGILIHFSYLI